MYIILNNNKINIIEANTIFKKFRGFMFKKKFNYGLRFRCNGIHTFFMKKNIDVILTDKNNNVLYIYNNLKKNRIILPKKNVYYTYELPSNLINDEAIKKVILLS